MANTNLRISMADANQNFSEVVRLVEEEGMAIIQKDNQPKYVVLDVKEYEEMKKMRQQWIEKTADEILSENLEAFKELAK